MCIRLEGSGSLAGAAGAAASSLNGAQRSTPIATAKEVHTHISVPVDLPVEAVGCSVGLFLQHDGEKNDIKIMTPSKLSKDKERKSSS